MNRNSLGIPHRPAWQKRDGIRGPSRHILEADNSLRPGQRGIEGKDTKEGEPNNDTEDGDEKDERAESHEDIEDTNEEEDGGDGDEGQDSNEEHYDYDEDEYEDKGDGAIVNYYKPGDLERHGAEAKSPAKQPEPGPSSEATTKNDPPSTSASDRKILAKKHITISDDRSVGSEFEVTRRDLLALKPREYKLQFSSTLQSIPQQPSSSSNPTSTLQPTASFPISETFRGLYTDGIEPSHLTAQQFQVPAGANATAQPEWAGYLANLAQQQATQMPGSKGMPNPGGPPNQGSPMMTQGQDGGAIANSYNPGEMGPNGMRGPGGQPGAAGGNHALQDYQMQLMLLDQQNKKRLMMAKQEQEEMTIPGGGNDIDIPTKQIPKPTMEVGSLRNGITANRHVGDKTGIFIQPKLHLISLENPDHLVEAAMQSRMQDFERALREQAQVGSSNNVTPDLPFLPQSSTSQVTPALQLQGYASTEDLDPNSHLDNLSSIAAGILGIPNASAVNFETLQAYVLDLQKKAETLETLRRQQEPSEFQIIHRVPQLPQGPQGKTIQLYFDAPQWSGGEGNSRALRSSLPISSVTSYLDKHPELVFVVYRDYDVAAMARDDTENKDGDVMPQVKHTGESLHPTTKALIAAVRIFLKSNQYFSDVATEFQNSELLEAPYLVIYHTRIEMGNFLHTLPEQQQRQFQLLLDYILSDYHDDYATVDALLDRGKITYPYIKYLFKPGDILVEGKDDNIRGVFSKSWLENKAIRNKSTKNGESIQCWEIETWSWEFTGVFSRMNCKLLLELDANDPSEKTIADLSLRPLAFMSDGLKALLKRRGETIWKCRIRHFVSYHKEKGREFHHSGDDRYMIDLKTYRELHKSDRSKFKFMDEAPPDDLGEEAMEKDSPPDATFLYLVPPTIKGYNLKRKKWLELQVDRIAEVVWNKEAFQSLVLDRKTKGLIEALISNQLDAEKSTDLISGKGNGLILLLHGGPGTGKTLTAESVAEIAEKPLYPVTCGDIGTMPDEVEGYLESVLNLGKTWQCVVLLDEADVFLEQRSLEDLRRNALVSVFLRVLEYYDGILVLTSNRVGIFDEAFKSRIQLALHYANLSAYQRVKIWQNFIERLEKLKEENVDFDDLKDHLEQLAENKMNGRQIRNAITTARQYAKWKGESLNYALMKDIIKTAGRFDVYIEKLNGGYSQDQLAEDEGLRLSGAA